MVFLSPGFLFGLAALSIPVIIHLFNFRKTRRVYFTNTRFLKNVKEVSTTRLKVKHWLILASRLLFLLFLVLAFAQPFIPAEDNNDNSGTVVIYLDNSFSMTNEVDIDQTALEAGINYVYSILDLFPADTRYKLITNDFAPYSNTFKSKDEILDLTTIIKSVGLARSAEDIVRRVSTDPDLASGARVFWISDFQKSSAGDMSAIATDSLHQYDLIPVNFTSTSNVYVDSVYIDKSLVMSEAKITLNVKVCNKGNTPREDVLLKVFLNEVQVGNAAVTLDRFQSDIVTFELSTGLSRVNKCRISLEEYPVTFDNEFYLTMNLQDRIIVTEVKESIGRSVVEQVYGNKDLFQFRSSSVDELDLTSLDGTDLVVLNGLNDLRPSLKVALSEYLNEGGSVAMIPGAAPSAQDLGSIISSRTIRLADSIPKTELAPVNDQNPFFANVFESADGNIIMPEASMTIRWGADRDAILSFKNGLPFLSQLSSGSGDVFLFACPLIDDYTTFQRNALFVPVMYKIAANSGSGDENLYYYLSDQLLNIRLDSVRRENILKMTGNGQEIVPSQRAIGDRVLLELPRFSIQAGFYDLTDQERNIGALAFNIDRLESDLVQYQREELDAEFQFSENINIFSAGNVEQFTRDLTASFVGLHLWKYAVILALIFLLAEVLLIRFL